MTCGVYKKTQYSFENLIMSYNCLWAFQNYLQAANSCSRFIGVMICVRYISQIYDKIVKAKNIIVATHQNYDKMHLRSSNIFSIDVSNQMEGKHPKFEKNILLFHLIANVNICLKAETKKTDCVHWYLDIQAYSKVRETWHICQLYIIYDLKMISSRQKDYETLLTNTGCEMYLELSFWLPIILINLNTVPKYIF